MVNTCVVERFEDSLPSSLRFTRMQFERGDSAEKISRCERDTSAAKSGDETTRSFPDEDAIATCWLKQSSFGKIRAFFPSDGVENPADDGRFRVDSTSAMELLDCRCQQLRILFAPRLTIHGRILYGIGAFGQVIEGIRFSAPNVLRPIT